MSSLNYRAIQPHGAFPGMLGVVANASGIERLAALRGGHQRQYQVRAVVSDHIPLAGSLDDLVASSGNHRLFVNDAPLTIYLHHGGMDATFFDLIAGDLNRLSCIAVEVEASSPMLAFLPARSEIGGLLDCFMRMEWLPLVVARLDLFLSGEEEPLCHQLVLPFSAGVSFGPMGGMHQFPAFAAYEALAREALAATSPFYRLLCAFRLYEGMNPLRRWLRELAVEHGVEEPLPRPPKVDPTQLVAMGFSETFCRGVTSAAHVWEKLNDHRKRVAHFLLDDDVPPLDLSDAISFYDYSMCGTVLLQLSWSAFNDLWRFFQRNLNLPLTRGSILLQATDRRRFTLKI